MNIYRFSSGKDVCLPIPKQGISLAMASLNLGWDTANTIGFRQLEVFAAKECVFF